MEILEGRQEYTFYESTNNTLTPDKMLSDIYEVIDIENMNKKRPFGTIWDQGKNPKLLVSSQ